MLVFVLMLAASWLQNGCKTFRSHIYIQGRKRKKGSVSAASPFIWGQLQTVISALAGLAGGGLHAG